MLYNELKNHKVVLFGAGYNGKKYLKMLLDAGVDVAYFVDTNASSMSGSRVVEGLPVHMPDALLSEEKSKLKIVITPDIPVYNEIFCILRDLGGGYAENVHVIRQNFGIIYKNKTMVIDIVNACNLRCKTCSRGFGAIKSTSDVMDIGMYRDILKKGKAEGFTHVVLYNWTEPFLCSNLAEYVRIAKNDGFRLWLSSNLSFEEIPHLEEVLMAGADMLVVSVSGHTQDIYEVNHRGGRIEYVYKHLRHISLLLNKKKIQTDVILWLLMYSHNHDSHQPLKSFAEELGIKFSAGHTWGDPAMDYNFSLYESDVIPIHSEIGKDHDFNAGICEMINTITIDCYGEAYLCCCQPTDDAVKLGNYLKLDEASLLSLRYTHNVCKKCPHYGLKKIPLLKQERDTLLSFAECERD